MSYRLHYAPDNASLIVRLALEELGAPYDTVLVDRRMNAQKSFDYLALNPSGRIPVLETEHGPIFETGAILLWLCDRHGALAPNPDAPDRTSFLSWLFYVANTLHPDLIQLFYPDRYTTQAADDSMIGPTRMRISHALTLLDQANSVWGAQDDRTNIIELYVATALRWCQLYPVSNCDWFDLNQFPNLFKMAQKLEKRPSVQAAIAAEGLNQTPFTLARYATPPEGSAL
jgi:glutathione S-transferase